MLHTIVACGAVIVMVLSEVPTPINKRFCLLFVRAASITCPSHPFAMYHGRSQLMDTNEISPIDDTVPHANENYQYDLPAPSNY